MCLELARRPRCVRFYISAFQVVSGRFACRFESTDSLSNFVWLCFEPVCAQYVTGSIPPLAGRIVKWAPSVSLPGRCSPGTAWCCGCCVPRFGPEYHSVSPGNGWWSLSSSGRPLCTSAGSLPAFQWWMLKLKTTLYMIHSQLMQQHRARGIFSSQVSMQHCFFPTSNLTTVLCFTSQASQLINYCSNRQPCWELKVKSKQIFKSKV